MDVILTNNSNIFDAILGGVTDPAISIMHLK